MVAQYCTPLIQALADVKATDEQRKHAENEFNKKRDEQPALIVGELMEILQQLTAVQELPQSELAMVKSSLVLMKNTIPKVWAKLRNAERTQLQKTLFEGMMCATVPFETRKRIGHCVENILSDKETRDCDTVKELKNGISI